MKTKLRPGWVLALLCTVLFFYGFYLGGVQLVISEVSREYGQNAAGMGGLVAAQHIAAVGGDNCPVRLLEHDPVDHRFLRMIGRDALRSVHSVHG